MRDRGSMLVFVMLVGVALTAASAASSLAAANDATLVAWSRSAYEVTVTVQVGEQQATARATNEP